MYPISQRLLLSFEDPKTPVQQNQDLVFYL